MRNLPFPKKVNTVVDHVTDREVTIQCNIVGGTQTWTLPIGTKIKLRITANFGIVVLPTGTLDKYGAVIPQRVFGV